MKKFTLVPKTNVFPLCYERHSLMKALQFLSSSHIKSLNPKSAYMKSCCNLISVYLKNKKRRVFLYLSVSSSAVEYCFRYSCLYNAHSVSSSGTRAKEESITAARYMLEINIFMSSVGGKYTLSIYKISIYL